MPIPFSQRFPERHASEEALIESLFATIDDAITASADDAEYITVTMDVPNNRILNRILDSYSNHGWILESVFVDDDGGDLSLLIGEYDRIELRIS